jgi:hypothetical protein
MGSKVVFDGLGVVRNDWLLWLDYVWSKIVQQELEKVYFGKKNDSEVDLKILRIKLNEEFDLNLIWIWFEFR